MDAGAMAGEGTASIAGAGARTPARPDGAREPQGMSLKVSDFRMQDV